MGQQLRRPALPLPAVQGGLADLHTAQPLEVVQQGLPVLPHGKQPKPLHCHNGHSVHNLFHQKGGRLRQPAARLRL